MWKCEKCQQFRPVPKQPLELMVAISAPWSFMKWGIDIVGKMLTTLGHRIYMLVLTDYFTKWVEVEALHQCCDIEIKKNSNGNILFASSAFYMKFSPIMVCNT